MKLSELAEQIGGELVGDGEIVIDGIASLSDADGNKASFLANEKYAPQITATKAAAVIVSKKFELPDQAGAINLIRCPDPYLGYREAMVALYGFRSHPFSGVSEQAAIDPTAEIADGVDIAPFATVSARVKIGARTVIYPGVFVGADCRIGEDCILDPNVCLYDKSVLGNHVTVHANTSIGSDGFGYATHANPAGEVFHDKIPTPGWVELQDDVEIGSCCVIERATMGPTVIGAGTKFADLVSIGHGTKLGKHCLVVSLVGIAGSTMIGNYCVFGGQSGVVGHIKIGDGVKVGAQSGIKNDVPNGVEMLGSPAIPRTEAIRVLLGTMKVPELRNTVKKLTKNLAKVEKQLAELQKGE